MATFLFDPLIYHPLAINWGLTILPKALCSVLHALML